MPELDTQNEETEEYRTLTKNVLSHSKFLGKEKRNIVEAVVGTIIVVSIIGAIPFTPLVSGVTKGVLGIATFYFCLKGIRGQSLTEIAAAERKFRKRRRRLHLRSPEYARTKNIRGFTESEDETIVRKYFTKAQDSINRFVERYGEEEDSQDNHKR